MSADLPYLILYAHIYFVAAVLEPQSLDTSDKNRMERESVITNKDQT